MTNIHTYKFTALKHVLLPLNLYFIVVLSKQELEAFHLLLQLQFDLSYPASLYPNLSIIRTRSRRDFFLCVYNNYGEKGDFKLNQNSYTNSHELPYDAKTNVGCLPLRSEINYGNIRLRMTLKQMSGVCLYVRKWITVTFGSVWR